MRIIVSLLVIATLAICHAQELTDPAIFHPPKPASSAPMFPSPTIMLAGESDGAPIVGIDEEGNEFDPYAVDGVDIEGLETEKTETENGLPVSFEGESDEGIAETINGLVDPSELDGIDDIDLDTFGTSDMNTDESDAGNVDDAQEIDGTHDDALDDEGMDADLEGIAEEETATDGTNDESEATTGDNKDDKDNDDEDGIDIDDDDEGVTSSSVEDMAAAYNGVVSHPEGSTDPELGVSDAEGSEGSDSSISFTHDLPVDQQGSSEMIVPRWNRRLGKLKSVDIKLVGRVVGTRGLTNGPGVRRSLSVIGNANIIVKGPSKFGRLHRFLRRLRLMRRLHGGRRMSRWSRFRIRRALMRARLAALRLAKHRRSSLLDISGNDFLNSHIMKSLILGKHNKKGMKLFMGTGKLAFVITKNIVPPTKVDNVATDTTDLTHDLALGGHLQITYHFKKHHKGDALRKLHKLIKYLRLPSLTRMRLLRLHKFFILRRLEHKLRLLKLKMLIRALIACKRLAAIKEHIKQPFISSKLISSLPIHRRLRLLRLMRSSAIRDTSKPFRRSSSWRTARLIDPKINLRRRFRSLRHRSLPIKDESTKFTFPIVSSISQLNRDASRSSFMSSPILSSHFRPFRTASSRVMNEPTQLTSMSSSSPVSSSTNAALPLVTRTHTGTSDAYDMVDESSD